MIPTFYLGFGGYFDNSIVDDKTSESGLEGLII